MPLIGNMLTDRASICTKYLQKY